jgi:hypothetical protein
MRYLSVLLSGGLLALATVPSLAQQAGESSAMQHNMQGGDMGSTMGMHMMTVTVTAIDGKSGQVDGTAGGMALKLHFPPPSLAGVKTGDKLMIHLSFHKV